MSHIFISPFTSFHLTKELKKLSPQSPKEARRISRQLTEDTMAKLINGVKALSDSNGSLISVDLPTSFEEFIEECQEDCWDANGEWYSRYFKKIFCSVTLEDNQLLDPCIILPLKTNLDTLRSFKQYVAGGSVKAIQKSRYSVSRLMREERYKSSREFSDGVSCAAFEYPKDSWNTITCVLGDL